MPAAALEFDRQRIAAGEGIDSDFRRAIIGAAGDYGPFFEIVREKLWEGGWPEAFSLQAAASAFADGDSVDTLRQTPDERFGELVEHLAAAQPDPERLSNILDAALDATEPYGQKERTPSARRVLRTNLRNQDRERFRKALEAALRVGSDETRLALFLDGYHDDLDLDDALRSGGSLSRPVVEGLLKLPGLSEDDVRRVLRASQFDRPPFEALDNARDWLEEGQIDQAAVSRRCGGPSRSAFRSGDGNRVPNSSRSPPPFGQPRAH